MKRLFILAFIGITSLCQAQLDISISGEDSLCFGQSSIYQVEVSSPANHYLFRDTTVLSTGSRGFVALSANYSHLDVTNTFTYDLWVQPGRTITMKSESSTCPGSMDVRLANNTQNWAIVPNGLGGGLLSVGLSIGTNGVIVGEHSANIITSRLSHTVAIDDWVHVAIVYTPATIYLYLDGVLVRSRATPCPSNDKCVSSNITGHYYSPDFNGNVDEFRLWDVALSQDQIRDLAGKKLLAETSGLRYYASFDGGAYTRTLGDLGTADMTQYIIPDEGYIKALDLGHDYYTGTDINNLMAYIPGELSYLWSTGDQDAQIIFAPDLGANYLRVKVSSDGELGRDTFPVYAEDCGLPVFCDTLLIRDTLVIHDTLYMNPCGGAPEVQYVKFESYYSEDAAQVNVYELQVYKDGVNIALNMPAAANSTNGSQPNRAVDGNHGSRWSGDRNDPGPDSINPHFLVVDLEAGFEPDSILLNIEGFDHWDQSFNLAVSSDSASWQTIAEKADTTGIFIFYPELSACPPCYDTIYTTINDTIWHTVVDSMSYSPVPTQNLVAYYPFNGNAEDESGNGYDGQVTGATLVEDRFGETNSAYSFDRDNDYIQVPNSVDMIKGDEEMTVSFWAYFKRDESNQHIIGNFTSYNFAQFRDWGFFTIGTNYMGSFNHRDDVDVRINYNVHHGSVMDLVLHQWEHITLVYDRNSVRVYVDGNMTQYNEAPVKPFTVGNNFNLMIGASRPNDDYTFEGMLDDIRIYNRALDSAEVLSLNRESPRTDYLFDTIRHVVIDTTFIPVYDTTFVTREVYDTTYVNQTVYDTTYTAVNDTLRINISLPNVTPPYNINTLKVYPNPARDRLFINTGNFGLIHRYQIKIINQQGSTVYETLVEDFLYEADLSSWSGEGLYFLQVIDRKGRIVDIKKIVLY